VARRGGQIRLTIDSSRFHFFAPDTGETLLRSNGAAP
jgi:hypothetical protein